MRKDQNPELLAPAGGPDAAYAALHYGADAVYLGLPRFSARADAENFTPESLDELVGYAHGLHPARRVYVTVNTLIQHRELPEVVRLLHLLAELRVDAVIVQDLGVARLVRRQFPTLRLHASTQMAIHNVEGARAARDLGAARVTLARELTLDEIRRIAGQAGIEAEVFVHGALCYAYSGLCLFSSHALGRSGNRGRCGYCCRGLYREEHAAGPPSLPFSMKDLALGDFIGPLRDAGVASLKIEGRMKSPLSVAAVTDYYRRRLDGRLTPEEARGLEEDLRTVFSRPWTSLYVGPGLDEPVDPVNVGHRGALVGKVAAVRRGGKGDHWLRFRTERAIEKHDGLQIDLPSEARPFGFAVADLRLASGSPPGRGGMRIDVPAGADVEVSLPPGSPVLPKGALVYCASSQAVKRRYPVVRPRPGSWRQRRPVRVSAELGTGRLVLRVVAATEPALAAEISVDGPFVPARTPEKTPEAIRNTFERMKDTAWVLDTLEVSDCGQCFVPLSTLNEARRRLVEELSAMDQARAGEVIDSIVRTLERPSPDAPLPCAVPTWSLKVAEPDQLAGFEPDDLAAASEIVVLLRPDRGWEEALRLVQRFRLVAAQDRLRVALPLVTRSSDSEALRRLLSELWTQGWRRWEVAGPAGLRWLADAAGGNLAGVADVAADWSFYVLNGQAASQAAELGVGRFVLSPEDDRTNLLDMVARFGERAIVPVFQQTPLFISETWPLLRDRPVSGAATLISKSGQRCRVTSDGPRTVVCDERPFGLAGHLAELSDAGARHFRADFAWGEMVPARALEVWRELRAGRSPGGTHDGNYVRGLA